MKLLIAFTLSCSMLGLSAQASAASVIDQTNILSSTASGGFSTTYSSFRRYQTVTVGLTGLLTQVDIQVIGPAEFAGFNILMLSPIGTPASILGTGSLVSFASGWASFSTSLAVTAGQVIAFEPINGSTSGGWMVSTGGADTYANGRSYTYIAPMQLPSPGDYSFRTYVDTAAVPEPASWAMMIGGFALLGGLLRHRAAKVAFA